MLGITTRKTNRSAFDSLMATVRAVVPNRCELCVAWRGKPGSDAPKGWKRCLESGEDKSPVDSCCKFKRA